MRIRSILSATALSLVLASAGSASAAEILTLDAGATVNDVDPAVNGWHGLTIILWTNDAGEPQVTLLLDGEPIESALDDSGELPPIPGLPGAPEVPDAGEIPDVGDVPDVGELPALPPAPGLPALPALPTLP